MRMICFKALEDTQTLNAEDMKVFWVTTSHIFSSSLLFVLPNPCPSYYARETI